MAKPLAGTYQPDKRTMFKIKHQRTADCVVAGYQVHASGPGRVSSAARLYNDEGELASVGSDRGVSGSPARELFTELQPLVPSTTTRGRGRSKRKARTRTRRTPRAAAGAAAKTCRSPRCGPNWWSRCATSTWRASVQAHREFSRWRPDRDPRSCTYEQLDEPVSYDLAGNYRR
ncbi:MAG: hypothetical protein R2742_15960 [Micropruina glycogenica]